MIIDNVKLLLDVSDTSKDDLLALLISMVQDEVSAYCNIDDIPAALDSIIVQIVVIKYNRLGAEGVASQNFNGASESFIDLYPAPILSALNSYRKVRLI